MDKKLVVILITLGFLVFATLGECEISVGVKKGDWMEYDVTTTGTPPREHAITWARMEILEVEGAEFRANVTSKYPNETLSSLIRFFNLEEGKVEGWIIIPANLSPGDYFYDASTDRNITIEGEETKTIAGSKRTVTFANTPERHKEWDKSTGFFVTTIDTFEDYTINATAIATNMWSPQLFGLDPTLFYVVVTIVVVVAIAAVALGIATARRKK